MASGFAAPVLAAQVGSYFVGQYYHVLQRQPDLAHRFYTEASSMMLVDGDSSESASGMLEIHTLIMSLNFTGIEIKTINSLESWSGGVFVVVSGSVRAKDFSGKRKFVQAFLLAPQNKGFFVLNDIFHFINEDVVPQSAGSMFSENKIDPQIASSSPLPEPPVTEYGFGEEASEYVTSVHISGDDQLDEYGLEEQDQEQYQNELEQPQGSAPETVTVLEETTEEEVPSLLQNVAEVMPEPVQSVEEPVGEPEKLTYASVLRVSVPSVSSRPSFPKSAPPASEWHQPQPVAQRTNLPEPSYEAVDENPSLEEEGESKSVYVRNLPPTISAADIEHEFKTFGRIIPDGVFIRNRKDIGVCYAFVEFEDLQAVQNAIKASPIQLAGRQVHIEERRANSSGVPRGGRRGRGGRGSSQSEAVRGRFSGRSFGRGGSQEARGNGFRGSY